MAAAARTHRLRLRRRQEVRRRSWGSLGALLTCYGFLAIFPLLLVLVTALRSLLRNNVTFQHDLLNSALAGFPIVGPQIRKNLHGLPGEGIGLVVGLVVLLWGSMGVAQAGQHAMAEVWNVPVRSRPGFLPRLGRSILVLLIIGTGVIGGATLTSFVAGQSLLLGAPIGGAAWTVLQAVGGYLIGRQLRHSSELYGFFAIVLGLMAWLMLAAQLSLYAAEINVVRARRLWPRSLTRPLTRADRKAWRDIAIAGERRDEEHITVEFDGEGVPAPPR